jgi:PKD repeat protein
MIKRITGLILFLILIFSTIVIADSDAPQPPHRFMGYAINEEGELAEDGTIISALNYNSGLYYNTTANSGTYGSPALTEEFQVEGSDGDTIYFYINGTATQQSAIFESGGLNIAYSRYLNLTLIFSLLLITSVDSSSITKTQAVVTWDTDRLSDSKVIYGTTKSLGQIKYNNSFTLNHEILIDELQSGTKYYFEVMSYDYSGFYAIDNNSGAYFSFTTVKDSNGGNDGNGGGGDTSTPVDNQTENKAPFVYLNGPYYGIVNKSITFDASKSNDKDGYIVEYSWNFGDGTTQKTTSTTITYKYLSAGNYTVSLTVKDNNDATNSTTTYANISAFDTDGDGWSDEAEIYYGYDPLDNSSYPPDNDIDGIPDGWDADDDNDGLTDEEEATLGSDAKDPLDVIRIISDYGLFFLVDTNNDGEVDHYYSKSSGIKTQLKKIDANTFLIDIGNDSKYDYKYNFETGLESYTEDNTDTQDTNWNLTILIIVIIVLIIIFILIVIYIKKSKPKKEKIKPVKKVSEEKLDDKKTNDTESKVDELFKNKK